MNILFLNSLDKSKWGGGEKWMIAAGKGLASRGHHVTIACKQGSIIEQKSIESGLNIFYFSIPADIAYWKGFSLKYFLAKNAIDVLICCQNKDVKIGARIARKQGIKAIFARQGIQNLRNKKKYVKPFTQFIDGIITNTESIKNIYESFGWFPENFIHVIYNGVEVPHAVPPIDLREKYDLKPGGKIIISAGRLDFQKGFDLLIEVALKTKKQHLDWQFIIAGEGKLKKKLVKASRQREVSDIFHLVGFSNQLHALISAADVFVLPSRYEGMPNVLLEAMSLGKSCVATSVNGASELVEDGASGYLVQSEHVDQLFEKLHELLSDEKLRKSMESKALERVRQYFSMKKMVDNLEKLLNDQIRR